MGEEACIRRLIAICEAPNYRGRVRGPFEIACEKADDKTLPIILEIVNRNVEQAVRRGIPRSEMVVFGEAGVKLSARLKDPEPLIRFAFETGDNWLAYRCSPSLKEKYVLQDIRRGMERESEGPALGGGWLDIFPMKESPCSVR